MKATDEKPLLLISGSGRSGTTIFRKIMERHPDVATIPEWRILTDPGGIVEYLKILQFGNPSMCDQAYRRFCLFIKDLTSSSYLSRIMTRFVNFEEYLPFRLSRRYFSTMSEKNLPGFSNAAGKLLNRLVDFTWKGQYAGLHRWQSRNIAGILGNLEEAENAFRDFLYEIALLAMKQQNRSRYMEKNTWSFLHFDIISKLYPNGKLVNIHRDPRDVVASYTKQIWMPKDPVQSAYILKHLFDLWRQSRIHVDKSRWMEIGLNELVVDTEKTLRRVCDFWEIGFDPSMLTVDLSRSNSGRWKKDLSINEQNKVEEVLREIIEHYGYE